MNRKILIAGLRRFAGFVGQVGVVMVGAAAIRWVFEDAALVGVSGLSTDIMKMAGIGIGLMIASSAAVAAGEDR